jgi:septal ring factor EnvC (AmiA/AmiB activator)
MNVQKLTNEELEKIKQFQSTQNQIVGSLGEIEIQKQVLEGQKNNILNQFQQFQEEQNKFSKELQDKYGDGNINIETGEFTSSN